MTLISREDALVPSEHVLIPSEDILIGDEDLLIASEDILIAHPHILIPSAADLKGRGCEGLTARGARWRRLFASVALDEFVGDGRPAHRRDGRLGATTAVAC